MTTSPTATAPTRARPAGGAPTRERRRTPLTRDQIVATALDYIDKHGLDELSMHKLGAELGVKGMSLYNHVTNKDDVLDGVVDVLWTEVEQTAPASDNWQDGLRAFAHAMRNMVHRHPNAASLITSQSYMPQPALRVVGMHADALVRHGQPEEQAYAILRTVTSYTLGSAFNEIYWSGGDAECTPAVTDMIRPGTPEELARVAEEFCGRYDFDAEFERGLDLMLRGMVSTA